MRPRTATAVACQGNDGAGTDVIAFGDEGLGEVAIADGEVAVTEGDIKTRTFVSAYLDDFAVHHGVCWFVICLQIKPAMSCFSFCDWVSAIAERAASEVLSQYAKPRLSHAYVALPHVRKLQSQCISAFRSYVFITFLISVLLLNSASSLFLQTS